MNYCLTEAYFDEQFDSKKRETLRQCGQKFNKINLYICRNLRIQIRFN